MIALFVAIALTFSGLVQKASQSTEVLQTPYGDMHVLERIVPNKEVTHTADYFSVMGFNMQGVFHPTHVEIVSENWVLGSDGLWNVDQWTFTLTLDGELKSASHNNVVEEKDTGIIHISPTPPPPTDEEVRVKLQQIEADWRIGFLCC